MGFITQRLIQAFPGYPFYRAWQQRKAEARQWLSWQAAGRPLPLPHRVKQLALTRLAQDHAARTFVETGTYMGDMVQSMRPHFDRLYSIELSMEHVLRARARFRYNSNIEIWQGDSAEVLPVILPRLSGVVLFWLDGHYSGENTARGALETPICRELQVVFSCGGFRPVVVIDDARCFNGAHDYPRREEIENLVARLAPVMKMTVNQDMFIVTRGES